MANPKLITPPLLLLFISPILLANTSNVSELESVTVVGEKSASDKDWDTRETQFYRAYSRETVDQETISQEGATDVTEAISDISGITINAQGAFSKSITIRGLDGPRVSTIVDGVRIGNQGMTHTGAGEINMTDLAAVSSIDVIKGSPSVTYDPGASAGVVKVQTLSAPTEKGIVFKQKAAYDEGYGKTQFSTIAGGSNGKIGGLVVYSKEDASDYKIADEDGDKELLVNDFTLNQQLSLDPTTLNDLGYDSESITLRGQISIGDDTTLSAGLDRWEANDIVSIHGNTTDDTASIFTYDKMERDKATIALKKEQLGKLKNIEVNVANQRLYQLGSSETTLESNNFSASFDVPVGGANLSLGAEVTLDQAETLVYSEQDYMGAYANLEYELPKWILSGGIRANHWETRQKLLDGANAAVASQLLGISGVTPAKTTSEPTWSLGSVYKLSENQNISFNLSSTYRNPDLYERYAFGSGFIGGGIDMEAESGKHAELAWKYLNDNLSVSGSVFYSDFENYINTKVVRRITDAEGLQNCILINKCDPANGEYNDQESDFFSQHVEYYNSEDVNNVGAEISARLEKGPATFKVGASYNDFKSDDIYILSHAFPLKLDASYKYEFANKWKPWVKLKGEFVSDYPEVVQTGGFDPYFKTDLHAGFKAGHITVNAGINNLFDEVYRPPYNGINGLEQSYFVNMTYEW